MPWLPTHADRQLGKIEVRQIDRLQTHDGEIGDARVIGMHGEGKVGTMGIKIWGRLGLSLDSCCGFVVLAARCKGGWGGDVIAALSRVVWGPRTYCLSCIRFTLPFIPASLYIDFPIAAAIR